jgi:hypothetical protein
VSSSASSFKEVFLRGLLVNPNILATYTSETSACLLLAIWRYFLVDRSHLNKWVKTCLMYVGGGGIIGLM